MAVKLGSGTHIYEVAEGWAKLPEHIKLGYTHGVVTDSKDRVYVHNTGKDAVVVFDREGNFLTSWGEQFEGGAHGMVLSSEGGEEYLYFADTNRRIVVKTTLDGQELLTVGVPDLPEVYDTPEKYVPTDVAVAPNGDFYVCDGYGQSWIHQYNQQGERIRSWGGQGSEPGKMLCSHGIWVDTRGTEPVLYVADRSNHRIQIFTLDGEHIRFVYDEMNMPCDFHQYKDELYIPDLHSRVTIIDKDDKLIAHLGHDPEAITRAGWPNIPESDQVVGKFSSPHAVWVDAHGDLYVVEWVEYGRITKLVRV